MQSESCFFRLGAWLLMSFVSSLAMAGADMTPEWLTQ